MSKAKTLKALYIFTILEAVGMIAWPIKLGWGQLISVAGALLAAIFVIPFIYYVIFALFLSLNYSKRKAEDQNIGLMIFLNVLPVVLLLYILDIF